MYGFESLRVHKKEFILFVFCEMKSELVERASGEVLVGTGELELKGNLSGLRDNRRRGRTATG